MLKNRLFVVTFTMFCCNLFCLSLSKANSLKSIKNIFGKQQSCLSTDSFKAEWDCGGSSFKTKLCAFGENEIISLIYSVIDDLNECVNTNSNCTSVSTKITALKTKLGNSLRDSVKSCLGILETETGMEILNNINDDVSSSNVDNYKKDIQNLYKYKYCLEGSKTSETTDDILYIDKSVETKEGLLLLLYKQLYYELTAINNLVSTNENETHHEKYEYAKDQILVIVDRILYKENNQDSQGLLDIYANLDNINAATLLEYSNVLMDIKKSKLTNVEEINVYRKAIKEQITDLEKAKISDCSDGGVISQRDDKLKNEYCGSGDNKVKQKYAKIDGLIDELEAIKVTPMESVKDENNNVYYIENYITVMQNKIDELKTEITDLKNLVNQYSSDLMMDVNVCFNQYISTDTIINNFDKLDFYFNGDNNVNSLVKYYRYLKKLNLTFGGSAIYNKDEVSKAYTEFDKKMKTMFGPQEFFINFLNYNSSFINLIISEENKVAEIFKQELFSEEMKAVVYDNAIIETMCYIMDLITGNIGRSIMALSLIITAFMWLQGKIEPKELFSFVIAIAIMYGSLSIANLIAKNNYSCGVAKSLGYIERTTSVEKCEDGFIWSMTANKCVAKSCYNPNMENVIFYSDYAFYKGNSVLGECVNGYEGKVNAKCIFADEELIWEYTGGCEKIYCYVQPSYEGVEFDISTDEIVTFDYRAKVNGKCKAGYEGNGYTATCSGKNKWSYSGDCQAIYCSELPRATDGTTKQASWPATKANSIGYGTCFSPYVNTYFADPDLNPNNSRSVSFAFCDENGKWDFQKKNNPTLLEEIYSATTKAKRDEKKKEFQSANNNSKYSKYLCEISKCEAINLVNSKTGNAIWPESDIGDENIVGICGSGYYYNNGVKKTIDSVETYDLKNQYLTDAEQNEIDNYFKNDLETILAGLSDEIKKKYNLNKVEDLTDEEKDEIIRTLKIEEITTKMQSKDKDSILGKCQANGEIVPNTVTEDDENDDEKDNKIVTCYKRKCPAITKGDKNSNYATWPETEALTLVENSKSSDGKTDCISGYGGSHSAYCDEFGTWHFDSYTKGYKTIKLESCVLSVCNEDITASLRDNNGFSIIGSWDDKIKWNMKAKIKNDYALKSTDDLTDDEKNTIKKKYKLSDINDIVNLDEEKKKEIKTNYALKEIGELSDTQKNEILGSLKIEYLKNKDLTAIIASLTDKKIAKIKSDYGLEDMIQIKDLSYAEKNRIIGNLKIEDFKNKDLTAVMAGLLDEEGTTAMSVNESERKQGATIEVYCDDNSEIHNYVNKNESFEKDDNGISYITAVCSDKNEWITNGKCVYKPCEAIKKEDANLKTGWAYFDTESYPESGNGWAGYCHSYFANDKKTFNNILLNKKLETIEDLKGRVLSFSDIIESLKDGQIISGDDASCKFDKNTNKSVLSIAKNQCKVPVIFADLYKKEGVLKFFDVGTPIECSKENFNFEADTDNNSFVCIMFTSTENHYNYTGKRGNKSYKILAVEGETITPGVISNITEFEDEMFDKSKLCHPVTVEMDINKSAEHFSFGSNVEKYIYKNKEVSYQDSGLIKDKTKTATYSNACEEGYVGNPVVKCGDKGIWEPTENKCEQGCYISDLVNDITSDNFQNDFNKIDTTNLFTDKNKNGEFETKLDFTKEIFVKDGTYLKIPLNGCKDDYAGIPIVKCEGSKWKWETEENTNNYCYKGGCYFSTYANTEGTSGWKILDSLNDFSKINENAIVKNNEYMIANCNDGMVSNADNNFIDSTVNPIEQQKHIIVQCQNGIIKPYSNSGTACVPGCAYGDTSKGWNENMFSGTDPKSSYSMFVKIGETTTAFSGDVGSFSVRGSINSVVQKECEKNYSAAEVKKDGYSCNSSLSTQPVVQCENGMWKQYANGGKHCYTCGIVVQYYSPRDDTLFKEKVFEKGAKFKCTGTDFGGEDPDPDVKKLCRIKGNDKYFGYEGDGITYTVNDELFTKKSSACHIAYVKKDLSDNNDRINNKIKSDFLSDYTKAGGETKLHNDSVVYGAGVNNGGLRQNSKKYTIKCTSGYAGAPEIVCNNGTWTWNPVNNTDNQCYEGGCDVSTYHTDEGYHLSKAGWGIETKSCSTDNDTTRKIIPNGSWASAKCQDGYISNVDNPIDCNESLAIARQKSVFVHCEDGHLIHQPANGKKHGDACVRGCVYGDTSMGWTAETMKNTVPDTNTKYGGYKMFEKDTDANIGTYALRLGSKSVILYKYCKNSGDIEVTEKEVYGSSLDLANNDRSTVTFTGHMNNDYGPYDSIGSIYYTQQGGDLAYYYYDNEATAKAFYKDTIEIPLIKCNYDTGKWEPHIKEVEKTKTVDGEEKTEISEYKYYTGCDLSGCTEFAYQSNGANNDQGLVAPALGLKNLKIQVWGAQGGNGKSGASGGKGGYAYGELSSLPSGKKINVITGQWGGIYRKNSPTKTNTLGAGKGGYLSGGCGSSQGRGGAGGGGSKVVYEDKILQAGGGGGASEDGEVGGAGGGANQDGLIGAGAGGKPGTISGAGGCNLDSDKHCAWNNGGAGEDGGRADSSSTKDHKYCGGGGGGGYYGGASGDRGNGSDGNGGGGGGSGYAVGFTEVDKARGVQTANGLVRICWGGSTSCDKGSEDGKVSRCEGSRYAVNGNSNLLEVHYGEGSRWRTGNIYRYGTVINCSTNTFGGVDPIEGTVKYCCMPGGFAYQVENGKFYVY